jgi:transcriptional regulator with XRE-family HTH domain
MPEEQDEKRQETAGAVLRRERESRGVSVEQVASGIRVGQRFIEAIEADRYPELPPRPYLRGFLGAYSEFLNLDPDEVFTLYEQALERAGTAPEGDRRVFRYPEPERFNWRDWTIPLALAAGTGVFLVLDLLLAPPPPEIVDLTVPQPQVVWAPPAQPPPPPVEQPPLPEPAPGVAEPVPAPGVGLLLKSEGATWVAAAADGGEEKRYEVGPGQNLDLAARERLAVTLGDAGLIRITYNGRELGFIGEKGQTKGGLLFVAPSAKEAAQRAAEAAGD